MNPEVLKILSIPKMQEFFVRQMGPWQLRDLGYVDGIGVGILHSNGLMYFENGTAINPDHCKNILRIPLAIDDRNPERGLWGMVDWNRFECSDGGSGSLYIYEVGQFNKILWEAQEDTPTIALLKALMAQEGIEDER